MNGTIHGRPSQLPQLPKTSHSGRALGWAWLAVVLIPVAFALSFAWGYVAYDLFGYAPENADAPWGVDLFAAVTTAAIALVPCVAAVLFGVEGRRAGDRRALVPLLIGVAVGVGIIVLTALSS